jgi:ubiquinone/menaquinone biosynthesis C-methylase UbiE
VRTEVQEAVGTSPGAEVDADENGPQQKLIDAHFQTLSAKWRDVYEENSAQGAIYRKRLQIVLDWIDDLAIPVPEKVLEIGCGAGRTAVLLAKRGYAVSAIDSASNMLAIARQHAADAGVAALVDTGVGNAHRLDFPNESFGLVLAIGVMPYLHSPEKALTEMTRVLKPGGFLVITAGNRWRLNNLLDPWLCPPLQPARRFAAKVLRKVRKPRAESFHPPLRFDSSRKFNKWLSTAGLVTLKKTTVGFQPLTFRWRPILSEQTSITLNHRLQSLVDRNVPGVRSMGMDYIFLARKISGD